MDSFFRIARAYWNRPSQAAQSNEDIAPSYGAFKPTWFAPFHGPRNDDEAQKLYNHIRTVAWYLDALPLLTQAGLPFQIGFDAVISAIPVYGDIIGVILALYQVFLSWLFGVPLSILKAMAINAVVDGVIGFVPVVGDLLDVWFKANLRNLALLEDWLLKGEEARQYSISLPPNDVFLPRTRRSTRRATPPGQDPKDKYRNRGNTARTERDEYDLD